MCGVAGFIASSEISKETAESIAIRMSSAIVHRGPDDHGVWFDESVGVTLAHRRLSILDLSPAGQQPMVSPSGRFVIVFNGEVYNHLEIRKKVQDSKFKGHSDTETLLAGIDAWGLEHTLRETVGMFALALWDRKDRALYLARDRMGEKSLYYGWQNGIFLFGSELKALKAHPSFAADIDRNTITLQLRHNCIPSPYSIYKGV